MATPNLAGQVGSNIDFVTVEGMTKNKSGSFWPHRLFKQSATSPIVFQRKTCFTHRYHAGQGDSKQAPFSAFFSGIGKHHTNLEIFGTTHSLGSNTAITPANRLCTVLNCCSETPDTKTFRFGTSDRQPVDYLPGQYISLSVVINGQEYKRSYSLASSPCSKGMFEITVKRDPNGGIVSNWLNDELTIGNMLNVKGPYGKFTCAKNTPNKILFIAAGSGVVPIMSMLRWLADTKASVDVVLLLSFQTPNDIIYREELNVIAAHHKNIQLFIALTKEPRTLSQWPRLTGRISQHMLAGLVPDLTERTAYLCGSVAFMDACKQNLVNLKLPAEQLLCENFTVSAPVEKIKDTPLSDASPRKSGNFSITFAKSDKTVAADGAMTLLELAEKSGIHIGHECRAGSCGECMIKCLNGKINMTEQAEIADFDRNKGWVYACCAYPASNAELDV